MMKNITNRNANVDKIFEINKQTLGLTDMDMNPRKILFTKKEVKDLDSVKNLFKYYEYLGFQQVDEKFEKITKLYEMAYGKINNKEFNVAKETYNTILDKLTNSEHNKDDSIEEVELKFFPLIPPVVNSIINDLDKKYTRMYAKAINPEAINTVIEARNEELRNLLVEQATKLFQGTLNPDESPEVQQENQTKFETFQKSQEIQEYYQKNHRLEVELFVNHVLNIEEQKYNIKDLEKQVLEKVLVSDLPFIRTEFNENEYRYVTIDERNCFYLRSPLDEDASQYMMFGTFNYTTIDSIIGKYKVTQEVAEKLEEWSTILNGRIYHPNRVSDPNQDYLEIVTENIRWHKELHNAKNHTNVIGQGMAHLDNFDESSEIPPNLIRECIINFKLPRKKGELTYLVNGVRYTDTVDEGYKVYIKPEYDLSWSSQKTKENLVHGEHLDWYYESESWTGIKLDIATRNPTNLQSDVESVWIKLERDSVQVKDPFKRFSTILPVSGGRSSQMTDTLSLVEKGTPWQSMYNFLGNKCQNLLATEIGAFFIMNQGMIPTDTMDGSWSQDSLLKFGQLAHDFGITVSGMDLNTMTGQQQLIANQGYGQQVDLTKTSDIMNKFGLMFRIKQEFYSMLGISPEQLAEISPYQSGKSVAQGLQRSSNMLHHYYKRTKDIIKRARQIGLYYAKYLQEVNPKDLVYTSNEGLKIIHQTLGKDFTLADIAIYIHSDLDDNDKLNDLYQLVLNDNTMGADSLEKASMLFSKTSSEVLSKLKSLKLERDNKIQEERDFQSQQQQQMIEAQKEQFMADQQFKKEEAQLDREFKLQEAEIKSYGYANSEVEKIAETIDKANEQFNKDRDFDLRTREILNRETVSKEQLDLNKEKANQSMISKESIELMKIKQRDAETDATNRRTLAMMSEKNKNEKSKNNK